MLDKTLVPEAVVQAFEEAVLLSLPGAIECHSTRRSSCPRSIACERQLGAAAVGHSRKSERHLSADVRHAVQDPALVRPLCYSHRCPRARARLQPPRFFTLSHSLRCRRSSSVYAKARFCRSRHVQARLGEPPWVIAKFLQPHSHSGVARSPRRLQVGRSWHEYDRAAGAKSGQPVRTARWRPCRLDAGHARPCHKQRAVLEGVLVVFLVQVTENSVLSAFRLGSGPTC